MLKVCKQCGRELPEDSFRKYAARGRGVYKTEQGRYTICKECEAISRRADYAMKKGDAVAIEKLREHYGMLMSKGHEPATAAAKRLMGMDVGTGPKGRNTAETLDSLLASVQDNGMDIFVAKLEKRQFADADEAYEAHKAYINSLRGAGLLERVTELIEAWYDEEDEE